MNQTLRPYPDYKDSRLPWLGKIPAHWDELRAKYFFREVDERSATGQEEMLSVSHITGVTPRSRKNVTMFKSESNVGHKLCHPGDLVINTMWAWMAALGVAKQTGIVSPSYAVYRPIRSNAFVSEYIDHLLRTKPYATEIFAVQQEFVLHGCDSIQRSSLIFLSYVRRLKNKAKFSIS